jgi:hypothetical protein
MLAQRVTDVEVLRITEIAHFQAWLDKSGNALPLINVVDAKAGVTFPDLNSAPFGGEGFQTNIMPAYCSEPAISGMLHHPSHAINRRCHRRGQGVDS